nr:replication protein A 70 kDa DNA-binding subunit E-like [Ipomoea batatas]
MSKYECRNLRRRLAANALALEKGKKTSQAKSHFSAPIISDDFENHPFKLSTVSDCTFCGAKRFQYEPPGFCCRSGEIKLVSNAMPCVLKNLFTGCDEASKNFMNCVRTYNNTFAFTSLGIHNHDKDLCRRNKGIYTFRVQGQMYHLIDDLIPHGHSPRNLQLYFFDTDAEVDNRVGYTNRLDRSIVSDLVELMSQNPYAQFFRSLKDVKFGDDFVISLNSTTSLDQRVYNLPTASQVAAIWLENDSDKVPNNRSIKVYACVMAIVIHKLPRKHVDSKNGKIDAADFVLVDKQALSNSVTLHSLILTNAFNDAYLKLADLSIEQFVTIADVKSSIIEGKRYCIYASIQIQQRLKKFYYIACDGCLERGLYIIWGEEFECSYCGNSMAIAKPRCMMTIELTENNEICTVLETSLKSYFQFLPANWLTWDKKNETIDMQNVKEKLDNKTFKVEILCKKQNFRGTEQMITLQMSIPKLLEIFDNEVTDKKSKLVKLG